MFRSGRLPVTSGTATLFAAPGMPPGNVIGECRDRHRASGYIAFLKKHGRSCGKGKTLHIIAGNYAAHKTAEVKAYIKSKGGRFETHFIPTHSSWLNLVERFFRKIATEKIRRESRHSVDELITAIRDYIKTWNKSKRKFYWSKSGDDILQKINKHKSGVSQT
jgi:transposase